MASVYILFSAAINKFYVGSTEMEINQRLRRYLSDHKGFTAKAKDWIVVYAEVFPNISDARKRDEGLIDKNYEN